VHVPTTLLSQVDASVGGKTGIDMDNIKTSSELLLNQKQYLFLKSF